MIWLGAIFRAAFVLFATAPRGYQKMSRRERAAYCLGVLAALFVPISGASILGISALFWPFVCASVFLADRSLTRAIFFFAAAVLIISSDFIATNVGTPGDRLSIECVVMAARLAARHAPFAWSALIASICACCAALSSASRSARSAIFAFAELASLAIFPIDAAAFGLSPIAARAADLFIAESIAVAIYFAIVGGQITRARQSGATSTESDISSPGKSR